MKRKLRKRIKYVVATSILKVYVAILNLTSRRKIVGQEVIESLLENRQTCIFCFWHQHIVMSGFYLLDWQRQGLKTGFLISPSGDGTLAAKVFVKDGVRLISGSSGRGGAQTLRKLYLSVKRDRLSLAITPDGPRGPIYDFKPGPLLLASMAGAPIVPIAPACTRYWQFKSWDKSILPKWFGKITMVVGEPIYIEKDLPLKQLRKQCHQLREVLLGIKQKAEHDLQ